MIKFFIGFIFLLILCLRINNLAYAAHTPKCTDLPPGGAPAITSLISEDKKVTITWTPAPDPVTHYLLAYGTDKANLIYGAPYIGNKDARTYTVGELTNGTRYYFRIRAVNSCKPGVFSHTDSVIVGKLENSNTYVPRMSFYKPVLGASTSAKKEGGAKVPVQSIASESTCSTCIGGFLLLAEIAALVPFFMYSYRNPKVKGWFSLVVPISLSGIFLLSQNRCNSDELLCEYFYLLNVSVYILLGIIYRQFSIHSVINRHA